MFSSFTGTSQIRRHTASNVGGTVQQTCQQEPPSVSRRGGRQGLPSMEERSTSLSSKSTPPGQCKRSSGALPSWDTLPATCYVLSLRWTGCLWGWEPLLRTTASSTEWHAKRPHRQGGHESSFAPGRSIFPSCDASLWELALHYERSS